MNLYLDNNATTRLDPRVKDAMMPYMDNVFGNPSSVHVHGQRTRHAVDTARTQVAALINAEPEEIIFTAGGTEACNAALLGHCRVDVKTWNIDMLSCSSHKLHGPMGVGALFVKRGTRILPMFFGGHQEYRRRAGTENVPGIVGFGAACQLAAREMQQRQRHVASLKSHLETGLRTLDDVWIFGDAAPRLPGTCYAGFGNVEGETLAEIDQLLSTLGELLPGLQ
ncbi:MAG: aminotransferase class V-fold PLP-dependent enzyme [Deltaproteobacteria bacterium]|nr:aminotransferase class V-fold PLP-dependent enzyme [Deltaproteobacteria bacterium]